MFFIINFYNRVISSTAGALVGISGVSIRDAQGSLFASGRVNSVNHDNSDLALISLTPSFAVTSSPLVDRIRVTDLPRFFKELKRAIRLASGHLVLHFYLGFWRKWEFVRSSQYHILPMSRFFINSFLRFADKTTFSSHLVWELTKHGMKRRWFATKRSNYLCTRFLKS